MYVTRWTDIQQAAPESWDALAGSIPFRGYHWLSTWWKHFGAGNELLLLSVSNADGQLIGIAPWYIESNLTKGRVIRFLGSGLVCSDYLSLLTAPECQAQVSALVAQWLSEHRVWDALDWDGVCSDDPAVNSVLDHLQQSGHTVHRREGMSCWRIALPDSWEQFLATLSRSHRKQIRRLQRRSLDSGEAILRTVDAHPQLAEGMRILVDLHQRRWQTLEQPGLFADSAFSGFLHEVAEQLVARQRLEVHWLELRGRAVAAEIHLLGDDTVFAYQSGVDPECLEDEPGRLITAATLQRAIERGRSHFDFLRGDEPYKAHWRAEPRGTHRVQVFARQAGGQIRQRVWVAGMALKNWMKTLSSPTPAE